MKKLIATTLLLLCTLVILGYKWWQTDTTNNHTQILNDTKPKVEETLARSSQKTVIEKHIKRHKKKVSLNIPNASVESILTKKSAQTLEPFEEVDIDAFKSHIKPLNGVEPLYAVKMKKDSIAHSHIGDTIVLPSIDGNSYEMLIKNKSHSATGNTTIHGEFSDNGITYHSVLTEGTHASFISMTTPTGSYEVNLIDTEGYIYASADIENKKIDYKKSDTIMAPIKEDRES